MEEEEAKSLEEPILFFDALIFTLCLFLLLGLFCFRWKPVCRRHDLLPILDGRLQRASLFIIGPVT